VRACRKDPSKVNRIHPGSIRRVGPLEHNKRRHGIDGKFKASAEKARQMRLRQDPSIANARVPDAGIASAARHRMSAARPNLEFMTALLRAILRDGKETVARNIGSKGSKRSNFPNRSCHRMVTAEWPRSKRNDTRTKARKQIRRAAGEIPPPPPAPEGAFMAWLFRHA
jgi:hypothetical protein